VANVRDEMQYPVGNGTLKVGTVPVPRIVKIIFVAELENMMVLVIH
jgi:hypothetical protein